MEHPEIWIGESNSDSDPVKSKEGPAIKGKCTARTGAMMILYEQILQRRNQSIDGLGNPHAAPSRPKSLGSLPSQPRSMAASPSPVVRQRTKSEDQNTLERRTSRPRTFRHACPCTGADV
jgi:hypothetical protein